MLLPATITEMNMPCSWNSYPQKIGVAEHADSAPSEEV